ncbi:hypothetical protein F2Q68_00044712 [Brassica cretica]|uniref:Uncharacterized protein n=2 Tax=Brassica cretica TaxID=69181 RepID=A0A3N6QPB0_BRACR|nr:hypothetical protein F2Q68_00044712 [Brassica cretica]KAF3518685.1 hypothetical protein DY000_02061070 [Brassica cretica]
MCGPDKTIGQAEKTPAVGLMLRDQHPPLLITHTREEMAEVRSMLTSVSKIPELRARLANFPTSREQGTYRGDFSTPYFPCSRSVHFEVGGTSGTTHRSGTI